MSTSPTRQKLLWQRRSLAWTISVFLLSACTGKPSDRETAGDEQPGNEQPGNDSEIGDSRAAGSGKGGETKSRKGENGKKKPGSGTGSRIGEIPLDAWPEVWLKQPLSVVTESGSTAGAEKVVDVAAGAKPSAPQSPDESIPPVAGKVSAPQSGATQWVTVISGEALADETKSIKNSLTPNLQDVGRYNSKWKDVQVDATVLAVLAGIVGDFPDAPSWKKHAKYIRDVSSQVASESKANGPKFYQKVREAYDKLDALLSGSKPPGLAESADIVKFSELANRPQLMKRMERGFNGMKTEINTADLFKKHSDKVAHEGSILSLLGKVIATPDYPDHDDPEYLKSAEAVSQSGRDIDEAVKKGDFKAYTEALDRCLKSCNKCHEVFKNG